MLYAFALGQNLKKWGLFDLFWTHKPGYQTSNLLGFVRDRAQSQFYQEIYRIS